MDAQLVQEYNGDTGKWDAVPPDPPAVTEAPSETPETATDKPAPPAVETADTKAAEKKPRNDPQARIDELTKLRREAERKAERLEAQLEESRRTPKPVERPIEAPAPDKFPDYATHLQTHPEATLEQWLDARDEWRDRQQAERVQTQQLEQSFTAQAQKFSETYAKAVDADPTLTERINPQLLSVRPLSKLTAADKQILRGLPKAQADTVAFQCFLADQWLDSEHPTQVLAYLSDPQTFQRLATLPPAAVVRDLAKYEAGLSAASVKTGSAPPEPKAKSATAAPIKPVSSSAHIPDDAPSDDDSDEEWLRKEQARLRKQRR